MVRCASAPSGFNLFIEPKMSNCVALNRVFTTTIQIFVLCTYLPSFYKHYMHFVLKQCRLFSVYIEIFMVTFMDQYNINNFFIEHNVYYLLITFTFFTRIYNTQCTILLYIHIYNICTSMVIEVLGKFSYCIFFFFNRTPIKANEKWIS